MDVRPAMLATRHRDLPVASGEAQVRVASTFATTGGFRLAARVMGDLVKVERGARPERARFLAYDWACWASPGAEG